MAINGEDFTESICTFARSLGLDEMAPNRCSSLLLIQLFALAATTNGNAAYRIAREIHGLETGSPSMTKEETQFTGTPLRGLWHKHYLPDGIGAFAINLRNGLKKDGLPLLDGLLREVTESEKECYVSEVAGLIAHDAVVGNWERRTGAKQVTGEWIVFARREGQNYYLCLGTHKAGDSVIRHQIDSVCVEEFPFLSDVLSKAG
jgi:hypothetical protein